MNVRKWKREYDGTIARACCQKQVSAMYGAHGLDVTDVIDADGAPIPDYFTDELACRRAASSARAVGLIQAWSLAEGPNGFSCMFVRFDGSAARNLETEPARAMCWLLLEISNRRN